MVSGERFCPIQNEADRGVPSLRQQDHPRHVPLVPMLMLLLGKYDSELIQNIKKIKGQVKHISINKWTVQKLA